MADTNALHSRPVNALLGKRIVVTRTIEQAGSLIDLLISRGAEPLLYPCIAIEPPEDVSRLDHALLRLQRGEFDWLVLTSSNAVQTIAQRAAALALDLSRVRVAAVGAATAEVAREKLGCEISFLPDITQASALGAAIPFEPEMKVLLPQSDIALTDLKDALNLRGVHVTTVIAYRTVMGSGGADVPALLKRHQVDAIIFTSPSTVRNFLWRLVEEDGCTADLKQTAIACIGATTAKIARRCGLLVVALPAITTLEYLVHTLEDYFS